MDNGGYENAKYDDISGNSMRERKNTWIIFYRQIFVVSSVWVIYFSLGLCFGAPTVIIAQMRREANSSDAVSTDMESWLSSVHGYSALPFVIILPISAMIFGRKRPFILVCLTTTIAYIIFYCGTTTTHVLISELMQGVLLASNITLLVPILSEYAFPHYREIVLTVKGVCFYLGVWVANAVGAFFHWKNIGIIGLICCAYSFSAIFWPESPSWLAMKGRNQEAAAAHHWLKGFDETSENEMEHLFKSQAEYREMKQQRKSKTLKDKLLITVDVITTKAFYYPLLITITLMSLYHFSGKFVCVMYSVQLIYQITNSEETAYLGMLVLEGITLLGMILGCVLTKYLKRRTLFLSTTSITLVSLYCIALYLYLINLGVILENVYVSLLLLVIFSVAISSGPMILPCPIFGEIISLKYRCSSTLILTFYSELLMATVLKLAPSVFHYFALHGAFLFYAICATIFSYLLFKYLPETKGKSLKEIEDLFNDSKQIHVTVNLLKTDCNHS